MTDSSLTPPRESTALASRDRAHDQAVEAILAGSWAQAEAHLSELPDVAPLDPDEARHGALELRALAAALGLCDPPERQEPSGSLRYGFILTGDAEDAEAVAWPALAMALAHKGAGLAARFLDIWRVDYEVWDMFWQNRSHAAIARKWLTSPGRRLLLDLRTIKAGQSSGGADMSLSRMLEAAGDGCGFWPWRTLHLAVPGRFHSDWNPIQPGWTPFQFVNDSEKGLTIAGLRALEDDDPLVREAALLWLLNRTAYHRAYEVKGVTSDLHADLPIRLAAANEHPASEDFDTAALRLTATLVEGSETPIRDAWTLARWLRGLLRLSPFAGGDPDVLAARLRAVTPVEQPGNMPHDVLDPRNVTRLGDHGFISAITRYHLANPRPLMPTPGPIVRRLLDIASPTPSLRSSFLTDELGWGVADRPLDLSTAARRLCTDLKIHWLTEPRMVIECLDAFEPWMAEAIYRERASLPEAAREVLAKRWQEQADQPRNGVLLAVSAGAELDGAMLDELVHLAVQADEEWQTWLLKAVAQVSENSPEPVMRALLEIVERGSERARAEAAIVAAQVSTSLPADHPLREQLRSAVDETLLRHGAVRSTLRRYGLASG